MKLLYIEDITVNAQVLEMYVSRLWSVGLDVAETAEKGISMLSNEKYDLIFMDINLPGMDGIEATSYIKNNLVNTDIPIIMVTASIDDETQAASFNAGADAFITKPVDMGKLKITVEKILRLKEDL